MPPRKARSSIHAPSQGEDVSRPSRGAGHASDYLSLEDDGESSFSSYNPFQSPPRTSESKTGAKKRPRASSPSKLPSSWSNQSPATTSPVGSSRVQNFPGHATWSPTVTSAEPSTPRTPTYFSLPRSESRRRRTPPFREKEEEQSNLDEIFFYSVKKARMQASTPARFQRAFASPQASPSLSDEGWNAHPSKPPVLSILKSTEEETLGMRVRSALLSVAALTLIVWTILWTWEKQRIGFCDPSSSYNLLMHHRPPSTLFPRPGCYPCPPRATCTGGEITGCNTSASADAFVLLPHTLQFGAFLPPIPPLGIVPACIADTEALQFVVELVAEIKGRLRRKRGEVLCNQRRWWGDKDREREMGVDWNTVREWVGEVDDEATLWSMIRRELEADPQCIVKGDWIASTTEELGWKCWIRLRTFEWLWRNKIWIIVIATAAYQLFKLRGLWKSWRSEPLLARELYQQAIDTVRDNALMNRIDPVSHPYDYVVPVYLRDSLMDEYPPVERKRVWAKVEKKVAANSNVRATRRTHKGENVAVWEWVGGDSPRKSVGGVATEPRNPE
ncbi:hypothetical protein BT69DRAFT_1336269 [Atractiella rhizophila]|nr:hypothetical protein BT69DRAFT_1336269 [Atractiella rhizophila]